MAPGGPEPLEPRKNWKPAGASAGAPGFILPPFEMPLLGNLWGGPLGGAGTPKNQRYFSLRLSPPVFPRKLRCFKLAQRLKLH